MSGKKNSVNSNFIIAGLITAVLISLIFYSGEINAIPYSIYEKIRPDGKGELAFIIVFDVLGSLVFFWIIYKILNILWKR